MSSDSRPPIVPFLSDDILLLILRCFSVKPYRLLVPGAPYDEHARMRRANLANLCLVCYRFNRIAQPLLFQSYQRRPNPEIRTMRPSMLIEDHQSKFRSFLDTVLQRPDLASAVRHLALGPWNTDRQRRSSYDFKSHDETKELRTLYHEASSRYNIGPSQAEWAADLSNGFEDAEVALLLMALPNVMELEIGLYGSYSPSSTTLYIHRLLQTTFLSSTQSKPCFEYLRRVRLVFLEGPNVIYDRDPTMHKFFEFLYLPGLKEFSIYNFQDSGAGSSMPMTYLQDELHLRKSPTARSLRFIQSSLERQSLIKFVDAFQILENVVMSYGFSHLPRAFECLRKHRTTIKHLSLMRYWHPSRLRDFDSHDYNCRLPGDFTALESLTLGCRASRYVRYLADSMKLVFDPEPEPRTTVKEFARSISRRREWMGWSQRVSPRFDGSSLLGGDRVVDKVVDSFDGICDPMNGLDRPRFMEAESIGLQPAHVTWVDHQNNWPGSGFPAGDRYEILFHMIRPW